MSIMRCQAVHNSRSGVTADNIVNTFYFRSEIAGIPNTNEIEQEDVDSVGTAIAAFFGTGIGVGLNSINGFRAMELIHPTLQLTVKGYDIADPAPREPRGVYDAPASGVLTHSVSLPQEVALCLSYRGPNAALIPARRRGRIYIGPWSSDAVQLNTDPNPARPNPLLTDTMRLAAIRLIGATADAGWRWVVYSPTATGVGAPVVTPITEVSTDDAFDTQRRRGVQATRRDVVTA